MHLEAARLEQIIPPLRRVGVKTVIDHFGRPQGEDDPYFAHVLTAIAGGGVWVKLSAPYRLAAFRTAVDRYAARLLAEGGAEHLLWASDWPFTGGFEKSKSYAGTLADLEGWIPDADARRLVCSTNPLRLIGIKGNPSPPCAARQGRSRHSRS